MALASRKSLSALRTHSGFVLFIENVAPGRNLPQEGFTLGKSPLHVVRSADVKPYRNAKSDTNIWERRQDL